MTDKAKIPETVPNVPEAAEAVVQEAPSPHEAKRFVWMAVISILLTIAAWVAGTFSGIVALIISAVAIVVGALALKSHRHAVRNTAITSIIAAAVLLVVIAAFLIVIYVGLKAV